MQELFKNSPRIENALYVFLIILCVFFGLKGLYTLKEYKFIGSGTTATNVISVSGTGEVSAVPDVASINFTVSRDAKSTEEAQTAITEITTKAIAYLKGEGVAEKDIKTENYNAYPKYEWRNNDIMTKCIAGGPCPPSGQNVIVSYSASQTITVKVREVGNAGKIITGLGALGVTDLSGPNFMIDKDEDLKTEARSKAIADAKQKAEKLSKELGVSLIRIVNFSDNSGGYPMPMYSKAMMGDSRAESAPAAAPLPAGENKYTSNVTITYEIR